MGSPDSTSRQHLDRMQDGRQRVAQLVGQRRQELVLAAVRIPQRLACSRNDSSSFRRSVMSW